MVRRFRGGASGVGPWGGWGYVELGSKLDGREVWGFEAVIS